MAIQLATSGSAEVLWSSPGSGRNACGAGSIELASPGAHCDTRCRVFDDKSCTLTTTFPRLLKGGALEPIGGGERGADAVPIATRWQLAPGPFLPAVERRAEAYAAPDGPADALRSACPSAHLRPRLASLP